MLLTALRWGGRLEGLKHSFTLRSPKWRKREEDRGGESRVESYLGHPGSPMALLIR